MRVVPSACIRHVVTTSSAWLCLTSLAVVSAGVMASGYLSAPSLNPHAGYQVATIRSRQNPNVAQSRFYGGYLVTFQFTQNSKAIAYSTNDQITVVFSNRSAEGPRAPRPLFGEDIVQEFSFSGKDFERDQLRFTRRVRDKSFLEARYIRVVNHGSDGWEGDRISLTVDGEEIFNNFPMSPRQGPQSSTGFQKFNASDWAARSYWEEDLQRHRRLPTAK
jgi:hypothetical protein